MNEQRFHQQLDKLNENLSRIAAALERMSSNTNSTEDNGYDDYTEEDYRTSGEDALEPDKIKITPSFYYLYFKSVTDAEEAINKIHFHISAPDNYMSLYKICRVVYGKSAPNWTKIVVWYEGDLLNKHVIRDIYENPLNNTVALRIYRKECVEDIQ